MLNNIRSLANHISVRIFLGFIAISFIVWGVKGALQGRNNHEIVSFNKAQNITEVDFLQEKAKKIRLIEQQNNITLSDEQIKELNVDTKVLKRLITERIINYIATFYDLDVSDDLVIETIKDSKLFKGDDGKFDINIFNANLRTEHQRQEYLMHIKENILNNIILSVFLEGYNPPKSLAENVMLYLSEARIIDLVSLNLHAKNKNFIVPSPSEQELEDFYNKNHKLFTLPETRSIKYLKISFADLLAKINVSAEEANNYYNENLEEFKNQKFVKIKTQIVNIIKEQRLEKAIFDLVKNLEEEVASGSTLEEMQNKYGGQTDMVFNQGYEDLSKDPQFTRLIDSIFEMNEHEISYPVEQPQQKQIVLIELEKITQSSLQNFQDIRSSIDNIWRQNQIANNNIQELAQLAKTFKAADLTLKTQLPIKIETIKLTRADLANNNLPPKLLLQIFEQNIGGNTEVVNAGEKIYFAHIKSANINRNKFKEIEQKSRDNIIATLRNSVMEELLAYFIQENKMQVQEGLDLIKE